MRTCAPKPKHHGPGPLVEPRNLHHCGKAITVMAQTMIDCWTFCFVKASSTRFPIFVSSLPIHLDSAFTGGHNRPPMIFASAIKRDPIAEAWPRDSIPQFPPPCLTTESLIQASSDTLCSTPYQRHSLH